MASIIDQINAQTEGGSAGGQDVGIMESDLTPRNPAFNLFEAALPTFNQQAGELMDMIMKRQAQVTQSEQQRTEPIEAASINTMLQPSASVAGPRGGGLALARPSSSGLARVPTVNTGQTF